jgi:hypothetical protein
MNFLGHVRVALHRSDDTLFLLGAILPDVESLVGQRFEGARSRPEVAAGIALHKATDAVFHADPRFTSGSIALTRALMARDVPRGAARAVGHAGWELLLDGLLVQDAVVTDAFARAIDVAATLTVPDDGATDRFAWFAARQRDQPVWTAYADPAAVADRLHRQLSTRPRLGFPSEQLPTIAEELAITRVQVAADGPTLIDEVTRAVASR